MCACAQLLRAVDGKSGMFWDKMPVPELVYLLFFYMALTFKGQVFPIGLEMRQDGDAASLDRVIQAKTQIYELVFSPGYYVYQGEEFRIEGGTLPPFPYLAMLLSADTKEFLKVLGIGFQDDSLNANDILMVRSVDSNCSRMTTTLPRKSAGSLFWTPCLVSSKRVAFQREISLPVTAFRYILFIL